MSRVLSGGPGGDRLSRILRCSTMGAGGFHGRVRDGIGWSLPAMATRSSRQHTGWARLGGHVWVGTARGHVFALWARLGWARRRVSMRARRVWRRCGDRVLVGCVCAVWAWRRGGPARAPWWGRVWVAAAHGGCPRACRAIRTSWLNALPHVHAWPIHVMVYHGPRGDLVSRCVSRLDAFSGYRVHT